MILSMVLEEFSMQKKVAKNQIRLACKRFLSIMDDTVTSIIWNYANWEASGAGQPDNLSLLSLFPGRWSNLVTINCSGN